MAKQKRWRRFTNQALLSCLVGLGVAACVVQKPEEAKTGETGAVTSTATGGMPIRLLSIRP
ncbi:MAG: hypothetical protein ACKO4S_10420 [Snowella sp.]